MDQIHISQVDTLFVNGSYPIELLLYFDYKINTRAIRKALKILSSSFWPLFGEYRDGRIVQAKYSENKFFRETDYDKDFNSVRTEMDIWGEYNQINAQKMEGLFFLSVIQLNNGTVLIPKMNHLVGDGYSYFYFLSVLAATAKSSFIPFKKYALRLATAPKIQRTVLKTFHFEKTKIQAPLEHLDCKIEIERVAKTDIAQKIKKIKTESDVNVTANDFLSAMIFKKIVEKKNAQVNDRFSLSIPMDVRRQVRELGLKFFGNGLMFHHLQMNTTEIKNMDPNELALQLRKSMPPVNKDSYIRYLTDLELSIEQSSTHSLKPYDPENGCLVTNLSRMPVNKIDFGSGAPDFVLLLTIGRNSTAILADKDDYLLRLIH